MMELPKQICLTQEKGTAFQQIVLEGVESFVIRRNIEENLLQTAPNKAK
jgi:hypothetical protein